MYILLCENYSRGEESNMEEEKIFRGSVEEEDDREGANGRRRDLPEKGRGRKITGEGSNKRGRDLPPGKEEEEDDPREWEQMERNGMEWKGRMFRRGKEGGG